MKMNSPKEVEENIVYLTLMTIFSYLSLTLICFITLDIFVRYLMIFIFVGWLMYVFKVIFELVRGLNEYHIQVFKVNMDAEKRLREDLIKQYEGEK